MSTDSPKSTKSAKSADIEEDEIEHGNFNGSSPRRSTRVPQPKKIADPPQTEAEAARKPAATSVTATKRGQGRKKLSTFESEVVKKVKTGNSAPSVGRKPTSGSAAASVLGPKVNWVACEKCQKWRIVSEQTFMKFSKNEGDANCSNFGLSCDLDDDEKRYPLPEKQEQRQLELNSKLAAPPAAASPPHQPIPHPHQPTGVPVPLMKPPQPQQSHSIPAPPASILPIPGFSSRPSPVPLPSSSPKTAAAPLLPPTFLSTSLPAAAVHHIPLVPLPHPSAAGLPSHLSTMASLPHNASPVSASLTHMPSPAFPLAAHPYAFGASVLPKQPQQVTSSVIPPQSLAGSSSSPKNSSTSSATHQQQPH